MQELFVSYETAKLLKEKGFAEDSYDSSTFQDRPTMARYWTKNEEFKASDEDGWPCKHKVVEGKMIRQGDELWYSVYCTENSICAPTQEMAMRWLRTCHCVLFSFNLVLGDCEKGYFQIGVYVKTDIDTYTWKSWIYGDTYEEVYEKAIVYSLENLVTIYDEEEED